MTKYSIIVPVYNASSSIQKCVESILNQEYENWELILVDDGSTDNSYEIIKRYSKNDNRIKAYHKDNSGPGLTRNYALKKITGDYILFVDSDDYISKNYLKIIEDNNKNKEYDLIFIGMINEDINGNVINVIDVSKFDNCNKDECINYLLSARLPWGPCSKVVSSKIIDNVEFSSLKVGEEVIYSFDLIYKSKNIRFLKDELYHYVHNEFGQHLKGGIDPWSEVVVYMKKHLESSSDYKKYINSINALALHSLLISVYRINCQNKFNDAKKQVQNQYKSYLNLYDFSKIDFKYLSKNDKILFFLLKHKLLLIIYLLSKYRNNR